VLLATAAPSSADDDAATGRGSVAGDLVFLVATAEGDPLEAREPDQPFNPASVVKVATTLWALERLGPDHRFETRFAIAGRLEPSDGIVDGDLLVEGGGDPDFHVENAYLVARALNRLGVREVRGALRVDDRFWIGWEGGSERRLKDPDRRAREMARRLRDALDPARWSNAERRAIDAFLNRRGLAGETPPRVLVRGEPERLVWDPDASPAARELVRHRSNRLAATLKRLNSYSNNDIERLGLALGEPAALTRFLSERWGIEPDRVRLETLSGLGSNRLSATSIVRLLNDLERSCADAGLRVADLLPVAGCDPGTLSHFPELDNGPVTGALTAKTGTLDRTDGGVAVLAGYLDTRAGERLFCVAMANAAGRLKAARRAQERWLLEVVTRNGGAVAKECPAPLSWSDSDARIESVAERPLRTGRTP